MIKFGLIGYPLSHSFSQPYFTKKFAEMGKSDKYCYDNYPLASIEAFVELLAEQPNLKGINVTIPYKEAVIPYLDELSEGAQAVGAVNTILRMEDGRLMGHNTDVIGFADSLQTFLAKNGGPSTKALILGTGGAAKAIAWVLGQMGVSWQYVSRRKREHHLVYAAVDEQMMTSIDLIVNTTPLGMSPNVATYPDIPYHCLGASHRLYDLVYNPPLTAFLRQGKERGAAVLNGLAMLHGQAEASWRIWRTMY